MRGIVCNMELSFFWRRFLLHLTLALVVSMMMCTALEILIPGFVTPFVDIVDVSFVVGIVLMMVLSLHVEPVPTWKRVLGMVASTALCVPGMFFAWNAVQDFGLLSVVFLISLSVLIGLAFFALNFHTQEHYD